MKIFAALKQSEFAAKLFSSIGFDFHSAFAAKDDAALKQFVDGAIAAAPVKAGDPTDEQVTALVSAELRALLHVAADKDPVAEVTRLAAEHAAITAQLSAAGIKFESPETLKAALDARISMRAGEELAKRGLAEFPEQQISKDPTKAPAAATEPKLTGLARTHAAFAESFAAKRIQNN